MIKQLTLTLSLLFIVQIFLSTAQAAVERTDEVELSKSLGIPVYKWEDKTIQTKAIIVGFHGMTFYGLALDDAAKHFAAEGYPVYSFDFRGFGKWHSDSKDYPSDGRIHYSQSVEDAQKLILTLHEQNPDTKIFCLGESLGSNLALWLISREGQPVDGAILCGLGVKESLHPEPRWLVDFVRGLCRPNQPFNLEPYIKPYLSSDPGVTNIYLHDPMIYRRLSSVELVKAAITNKKSIKHVDQIPSSMPLLIISGEKDRIFKVSALNDLKKKVGSNHTTIKILPNQGHLLLELKPMDTELASTIDSWLEKETQFKEARLKDPAIRIR